MKLKQQNADIFIPDGAKENSAFERITHLAIGAHQDDLEIMAHHGILQCYHEDDKWFGGVTCTSGGGSARIGPYAEYSDEAMSDIRMQEQRNAALIGKYGCMLQLGYASSQAKDPAQTDLKEDIKEILLATHPSVLYTHNPADKHDTHIGVFVAVLQAIREIPKAERPQTVYGCEVWRNLDWLPDQDKVALDVSGYENLANSLIGVYDSQIAGGKRYDLATIGHRRANATYFESHGVDTADQLTFAMDLSPLAHNENLDVIEYVTQFINSFSTDVEKKLSTRIG